MLRLSSDDGLSLLRIARHAITSVVIEHRLPDYPPFPPSLTVARGTFVTLHDEGKLRGCMGQAEDPGPLADGVARAAINAALHDPRFPPVAEAEIATLKIEISALSPLQPIIPDQIVAGRHGLMVVRGTCGGLLLPQVATERRWSGLQFLEETCAKAGLPRGAWRDSATCLLAFTAEIFSEAGFRSVSAP